MTNNPWVVNTYLKNMCQFVTLGLLPVINAPMVEPIDFEDWTFRYVIYDDTDKFGATPVTVSQMEKLVIINMKPELYDTSIFDYIETIADYLIRGFYHGRDSNPVEFLFGEDDTITDPIDMLCDRNAVFAEAGIEYVDVVVDEWAASLNTNDRLEAMHEIMQICDTVCELIELGV